MKKIIQKLISEIVFVLKWNFKYKNMVINEEKLKFFRRFANRFNNELNYLKWKNSISNTQKK